MSSGGGARAPVGVFDSGVGGLSVWREIVARLPHESTLYFADQAHVPYGSRPQEEVRAFSEAIVAYLLDQGSKAIVVACNTASAAALKSLRDRYPGVPILGMEPAVKPAVALTRTGVIGVMATPATFQGRLYQATTGRHATHVTVVNQVCTGLADLVETGELTGPDIDARLRGYVAPMLDAGADVIVLGCTHYPFVIEALRRIAGPGVAVVDPAPAIARHLANVLAHHGLAAGDGTAGHRFLTTGDARRFGLVASRLLGTNVLARPCTWLEDAGAYRVTGADA
ncbi:MAG: glutamate racemase [Betaproteobacteria bacterium]|nr:glutamate racemase [Betaproteobacteria bacterium]